VGYHLRRNRLALLVDCHSALGVGVSSFLKAVGEASGSICFLTGRYGGGSLLRQLLGRGR
jgi:hypothetical protein